MRKFFRTFLFTTILSILFGNMIFNIYKRNANDILDVMKSEEQVYMLLYGSYNSMDKVNNLKLDNYILENDDGYYKVYVGISKNIENANKVREIYNNLGNSIYIRDKVIDNIAFIDYLENTEINFNTKSNNDILKLENEIINKYKELK